MFKESNKTDEERKDVADKSLKLANEQKKAYVNIGSSIGIMSDKSKKYAQTLEQGNAVNSQSADYWDKIGNSIKHQYNTTSDGFKLSNNMLLNNN